MSFHIRLKLFGIQFFSNQNMGRHDGRPSFAVHLSNRKIAPVPPPKNGRGQQKASQESVLIGQGNDFLHDVEESFRRVFRFKNG